MSKNICFFEPNSILAERMVDYWTSHGLEGYDIRCYSDGELFLEHFSKFSASVWILDACIRKRLPEMPPGNVLWTSESEEEAGTIFKYRSAEVLLQSILSCVRGDDTALQREAGTLLIGLYTPVRRSLQTTFGITLSHILSQKGRTLYLNLEGYSGFEQKYPGYYPKDISDFIYHFNHSKEKNPMLVTNFIYRLGDIDIIPPVLNVANLQDITGEMWKQILCFLQECKLYDYIIVDVSDFVHGIFDILKMSRVIFSLTKSDEQAMGKWQQYCSVLNMLGLQEVVQKTRNISLPNISAVPTNFEAYVSCPFSDYVEQTIKEVGL